VVIFNWEAGQPKRGGVALPKENGGEWSRNEDGWNTIPITIISTLALLYTK